MEPYLILTLVITFLALGVLMHGRDKRKLLPFFERQALRLKGKVVKEGWFIQPQLKFPLNGVEVRLTAMSPGTSAERSANITVMDFSVPGSNPAEIRIIERRNAFKTVLDSTLPAQQEMIATGNPAFDERFELRAPGAQAAAPLLTDGGLQRSLLELPSGADICVKGGKCSISVDGYPDSDEIVDRLSAAAEKLSNALRCT